MDKITGCTDAFYFKLYGIYNILKFAKKNAWDRAFNVHLKIFS